MCGRSLWSAAPIGSLLGRLCSQTNITGQRHLRELNQDELLCIWHRFCKL